MASFGFERIIMVFSLSLVNFMIIFTLIITLS